MTLGGRGKRLLDRQWSGRVLAPSAMGAGKGRARRVSEDPHFKGE